MLSQASAAVCLHCGTPCAGSFCCRGCEVVYQVIRREGLDRFYDLGGALGVPATHADAPADHKWVTVAAERVAAGEPVQRLTLDVQGIRCAACVWLLEQMFSRRRDRGALDIVVNPALGILSLTVTPEFPLVDVVNDIEQFGYRLGPARKQDAPSASRDLLWRLGVCVALAMNGMIFGIATYAGLRSGPIYRLFQDLNFALAAAAVLVGGSVFFRSAWEALRRGLLHLDLPIAMGILLAFGSSTLSFVSHRGDATYFDTLSVFIALMLLGRFLQERVLEKNRRQLLAADGADELLTRRIDGERVVIVRCAELREGDRLLLAPGDLCPLDATLVDDAATFSLDWITGESAARAFARGDTIPAGAFNAAPHAVAARAAGPFSASTLLPLLEKSTRRETELPRATTFWRRLARWYVVAVLVLAGVAFAGWAIASGDAGRALEVTAAVLIVTCPCALGIATPLGYELAQAGLRRRGLYVRAGGFLDRATAVRRVVFDKTGTLTTGSLCLADPSVLAGLDDDARESLYNLVARSSHPKAAAVRRALEAAGAPRFVDGLVVVEEPGRGLELVRGGRVHRLDAAGYSAAGAPPIPLETVEELRPDAAAEARRLADDGYEVWILSGDAPDRVAEQARALGIPAARALGGQTPSAKAAWLRAHDRGDTLFIGDGINDSLAADQATCSGTPAIDRPFMPARSDFYFTSAGLRPVRLALDAARHLARVVRTNLGIAVAYNVGAVALSYAGLMSPLLCSVLMPVSSLTVIGATVASLSRRSSLWKS